MMQAGGADTYVSYVSKQWPEMLGASNHGPTFISSGPPQVQYVATRVALDPAELCVDFKLCTSNQTARAKRTRHLPPRELPAAPLPHATPSEGTRRHNADGGSTLTILQLTDIHIDPDYSEVRCDMDTQHASI